METDQGEAKASCIEAVLVIDDHPLYSDALTSALHHVFKDCKIKTATTLADGLKCVRSGFEPNLVMFDLKLPDVTGISGFLRLRDKIPDTPILVISSLASPDVVHAVMDAGAAGFVPKDVPASEIETVLCKVCSGEKYVPPGYQRVNNLPVHRPDVQEIRQKIAELTPQQTRIMKLICSGKLNKQIAYEMSLAEATVKAHITALLRRLGVQNRTQAAMLVESANLDGTPGNDDADVRSFLSK